MRFSLFVKLGYLAIFLTIIIIISFFVYEKFYNTDTAKVERFVYKNLKKEFCPDKIELEWKLSIANQTGTDDNTYGMFWIKSNSFYAGIDYNGETEEKNKISSLLLGIFFNNKDLTKQDPSNVLNEYLNYKVETIECKDDYCIYSQKEDDNEDKIFVMIFYSQVENKSLILICKHPVGSELYDLGSCF